MAASAAARTPGIAITIDDFDLSDTPLLSGEARDAAIRAALARHAVKAAGFVAGKYVQGARSESVLGAWSRAGHLLGNHSFSHQYFSGRDPDAFMADVLRCEPLLSGHSGFRKLFRFPFLAEGKTAAGRDRMRALLKSQGYANAHVTIDTSDWYIDNRLRARLTASPNADIAPYRRYYLDHIWARASFYDRLAQNMLGHSINHTILLHHRLTTGLFLGDLLAMFKAKGWHLIDAQTAFASPLFTSEPDVLPAGQSLVWSLAKADGHFGTLLRYPGEDGAYEAPGMDAAGL
ncbi:polysaccharide deacetylase family protein [Sphingomonas sp. TDK1]|uniref:polysaccharide deacetylase family protein n=1 Tax=Sphingomonas sp. TDK1 TaxID=453247 RepID=UPI0007D9B869|nr:polysaccharide deacetylase family protein [Sphingomonas sp. TDK1]OAN58826.1 polysaccharide deacetylase [Sphingomonas sp. TDK1]